MATPWQYNYPGERKPVVTTDTGYHVDLPNQPNRNYRADEHNYTAYIEAELDGATQRRHIWVHDIQMNFEAAGSYAQSAAFRAYYPRNFVQPKVGITGQTASQADYASLCEFIRRSQLQSLRYEGATSTYDPTLNTVTLVIPEGGPGHPGHNHLGHYLNGHIARIERTSERWINAPEFQFEFIVTTASAGIYETGTSDPSGIDAITRIMKPNIVQQSVNRAGKSQWALDPDQRTNENTPVLPDKPPAAGQ
jgi:hypothetical protein